MAAAKPKANDAELNLDLEVPKKSKGKMFILIGLLLVILGAGGGAAWWFLIHKPATEQTEGNEAEGGEEAEAGHDAAAKKPEVVAKPPIVYMPIDEQLVANIRSDAGKERILAFKLTFILAKPTDIELVTGQMPAVKAELLSVFGKVKVEQLQQPEAIEQLKAEALKRLQARLIELIGAPSIEKILFTSFLMQ